MIFDSFELGLYYSYTYNNDKTCRSGVFVILTNIPLLIKSFIVTKREISHTLKIARTVMLGRFA